MIVLLSCSMSCWANNSQLFYWAANDSVAISYDDLRIVNSKLIELEYEKDINKNLRTIIRNDSCLMVSYNSSISDSVRKNRKLTMENRLLKGGIIISVIAFIISIIK